jgi:ribonuclease HI
MTTTTYTLFFDGCSKGNPGSAGAGAVLFNNAALTELWAESSFVGLNATNNFAEYSGLVLGLREASRREIKHLLVKGDSKLVIEQMKGNYQVKSANLLPLYTQAKQLATTNFQTIEFMHIYRNENKRADALANAALKLLY